MIKHGLSGSTNHKCKCDICREAKNAYQREQYKKNPERGRAYQKAYSERNPGKKAAEIKARKEAFRIEINRRKMESGCLDCGYKEHPVALDYDHIKGEKLRDVGKMWNYSWERIEAEIEKCEVVCSNCHRIRTWNRTWSQAKGTETGCNN